MRYRLGAGLVAAIGLGACAAQAADANPRPKSYPVHDRGERLNGPPLVPDAALAARVDADGAPKEARRELAHSLIAQSDASCENYLVGASVEENRWDGGLSIAALLFSTLSGLASPKQTKDALSAGSTFAQGTRTSLKDTVLAGNDYQLIYTAVKNGRQERRRQLYADIETGAFDTWSSNSITTFLTPYHLNCGINYALERLEAATRELGKTPPDPPPKPTPDGVQEEAAQAAGETEGSAVGAETADADPPGPRAPNS